MMGVSGAALFEMPTSMDDISNCKSGDKCNDGASSFNLQEKQLGCGDVMPLWTYTGEPEINSDMLLGGRLPETIELPWLAEAAYSSSTSL